MSKARNIADLGSNDVLDTTASGVSVTGAIDASGNITSDSSTTPNFLLKVSGTEKGYIRNTSDITEINGVNGVSLRDSGTTVLTTDSTNGVEITSTGGQQLKLSRTGTGTQISSLVFNDASDNQNRFNSSDGNLEIEYGASNTNAMMIGNNGDIIMYKSDGSTAGVTWDASEGTLNLVSSSTVDDALKITGSGGNNFIHMVGNQGQTSFKMYENGADDPAYFQMFNAGTIQHSFESINGGSIVFNEQGLDIDFRVESNNNANILKVDGGTDSVGIGNGSPGAYAKFLSVGGSNISTIKPTLSVSDTAAGGSILIRGLDPTIYFDQTGGNDAKILTDLMGIQFLDGTLDAEGYRYAELNNGGLELRSEGGCTLVINADTDNITETHTPKLIFRQDGTNDHLTIGVAGADNDVINGSDSNGSYIHAGTGATGNRSLAIGTNENTAIKIDANNRINYPYQPAFYAHRTSSYTLASGSGDTLLSTNSATVNRGNHYSTSTGRFTAPVAGLYKFDVHLSCYTTQSSSLGSQDDSMNLTLAVNGSDLGRNAGARTQMFNAGMQSANGVELGVSFSAILNLNAGDYVQPEMNDVSVPMAISNTNFCGYLLG